MQYPDAIGVRERCCTPGQAQRLQDVGGAAQHEVTGMIHLSDDVNTIAARELHLNSDHGVRDEPAHPCLQLPP